MPDALSDAKAALSHANALDASVKQEVAKVAPPSSPAPTKPSYTAARIARTDSGIGNELSEKARMVANAKKALQ